MASAPRIITYEQITTERESLAVRLLARLDRSGGCWLWTGYRKNQHGHGAMSIHNHPYYVHRLAFQLFIGPIPDGMAVCHRCDVPWCVRPEHLFLGTQLDNIADMHAKSRQATPPIARGISNHNAMLTDAQVADIRTLRAEGVPQREVARRFSCSQSTVWRITHHITRAGAA